MAYCSVYGISYQPDDPVCTGCGNELAPKPEQEHETHPVSGDTAIFNRTRGNDLDGFGSGADQDLESQLGKGLIKPHSIELEIDGYHFKYDKPVRNFAKPEKGKEKVVEFRLTCPEPGSEVSREETSLEERPPEEIIHEEISTEEISTGVTFKEVSDNHQNIEMEEMFEHETGHIEEPAEAQSVNTAMENEDQPADKDMWVAGEILAETVETAGTPGESPLEPEVIPGFDLPEPKLESNEEDLVILWEDSQRWLGIPLANQYRISNRSLQVIDRLARKFSEVDLTLISEVKLRQSWLGKLLKTGDLSVSVKYLPETGLKLTGVRNPEKVHRLLEELKSATR
jgi:predicted RNA-binding Zn-ribbon protein involved in translation (DUF1610 family)